jgi:hypothetical protein
MLRISFLLPYKTTLFVLFVCSMYPWFMWDVDEGYIFFSGALVSTLFYLINRNHFELTKRNLFSIILLIASIGWCNISANIYGMIGQSFLMLTILLLINTKDYLKADIFKFITNGMALLLGISLVFYIPFLFGMPLPKTPLRDSSIGYGGYNYYGFIFVTNEDIFGYYRFKSIFAEPGHLTMGLIPLLFANRLNLRNKSVLVIFIAELLTLSLAGYIALMSSVILYSFPRSINSRPAKLLLMFFIFFSVYIIGNLDEKTVINQAIVERLKFTRSEGIIKGYNRTTSQTDMFYKRFIKSSDLLIGTDYQKTITYLAGSTGYKVYFIRFGLIGTLLVFLFYLSYALSYRKYEVLGLFLIIMVLLFQNGYPFWFAVIFGYILGVSKLYNEQKALKPT